jgi:molecular chaperone DnaK
VFSTAADNQTSVEIHVLQGEREMASDNKTLATFVLDGIPTAPRGVPQIEVTFDIDASGIVSVSAKDKASGKSQSVRIEASTAISKEEIERLKREAEMHRDEDKKKKELIEARNMADQLMYTGEKSLKDAGDKAPADIKESITKKIEALRGIKDTATIDALKKAIEELSAEMQKLGPAMGAQSQPQQPPTPGAEGEKKADSAS